MTELIRHCGERRNLINFLSIQTGGRVLVYRHIEKGTRFSIEVTDKQNNTNISFSGSLHEPVKDTTLVISNDQLFDYCAVLPSTVLMTFNFMHGEKSYSFEAKYDLAVTRDGVKLTEATAIGILKESSRRATKRFGVLLEVELLDQKDGSDVKPVCAGQSYDMSCDALSLWSNANLDQSERIYYARFKLFNRDTFIIPSRMLRKKSAPLSSFFRYEYVFLFYYNEDMTTKNRVLDAFINNSLEARRA